LVALQGPYRPSTGLSLFQWKYGCLLGFIARIGPSGAYVFRAVAVGVVLSFYYPELLYLH